VRAIGQRLKQAVFKATGLSCSVGLSPNKLLSKLCSDLDKPNGLTLVTEADVPVRLWPLPAKRINGIGPKASARLEALGVRTIGDLAAADEGWLVEHFGSNYGVWLRQAALGVDDRPVVTYREPKSLSRETTFERNLHPRHDREALGAIFTRLCEQVASDLVRKDFVGRSVGVKLRYDDFRIVTRVVTLPMHTRDAPTIRQWAGRCLKTVPLDQPLRLLGVKIENLRRPADAVLPDEPAPLGDWRVGESLPLF
jgi:DNA polymerase-4